MGCSSLICRALAGAAWSPSKVPINPSILDRIPPAHPRSKTIEKIIAFAICLLNKIDATRFSGPEQFFAGAPYIFFKKSNVAPMPRSIALLFFLASNISLAFTLHLYKEIDASRFFGARKMFCWREKYSTLEKSSSKTFNEEKFNDGKFIVENFQRRQQFNVEMHQGQTIFTVRNFISCRRV